MHIQQASKHHCQCMRKIEADCCRCETPGGPSQHVRMAEGLAILSEYGGKRTGQAGFGSQPLQHRIRLDNLLPIFILWEYQLLPQATQRHVCLLRQEETILHSTYIC